MFGLVNKKELDKSLSKSFDRIKEHIAKLTSQSLNNKDDIVKLELRLNKRIDEILVKTLDKIQVSNSMSQSKTSVNQTPITLETQMMKKVRRNKRALIEKEIVELSKTHSVIEMYDIIVLEKHLCSKASFYRYVGILKSQDLVSIKT